MTIDIEALKARTDIVAVVASYVPLQKRGNEFVGRCVAHSPDNNPSMWVSPTKKFAHCFGCGFNADAIAFIMHMEGCDFRAATEKLGATEWQPKEPLRYETTKPLPERITSKPPQDAGDPPMGAISALGDPSRTWRYLDAGGELLMHVARYDTAEGKEYRCWTWGVRGTMKPGWACGHWTRGERPLYGLDKLAARPDAPVVLAEGEKAADAIGALLSGQIGVTWPGGAGGWKHCDLRPLAGRSVLLWPDNDEAGIRAMADLAPILYNRDGLACKVRVLDPSGMPPKFDAADWTEGTDSLIAWAKPRITEYKPPQPVAASQQETESAPQGRVIQGSPPQEPPQAPPAVADPSEDAPERAADAPEPPPISDADFPPGARPERPKRARKPSLALVDGNAVRQLDEDQEILPHELSESGIAARFVAEHNDRFRTVFEWGTRERACWLWWNGVRWERQKNRQDAMRAAQAFGAGVKYWNAARTLTELSKIKFESKSHMGNVLDLASYSKDLLTTPETFDADPYLLGCQSVTVDLRTGKSREPERDDLITLACSVDPAPGPMPYWDRVISRASRGDSTLAGYIQRWCGYLLIGGENVEESFLFVYGFGASGKSKFIQPLQEILGMGEAGYFRKADKEVFTHAGDGNTNIGEKIARLEGARLVTCSELEEGSRWRESLLKDMTGRERVEGRALYADTREFMPSFKLIFSGNHKPALRSVGEEIRRRLHLLEFPGTIPEEDRIRDLPERLRAEYPAILAWMIQGALMWQDMGLGKPEAVIDATTEYLTDEDSLSAWFEQCCETDSKSKTAVGDAYRSYAEQAKADGEHYTMAKKRFSQRMADKGFRSVRGSGGTRYFSGFSLKLKDSQPMYNYGDRED